MEDFFSSEDGFLNRDNVTGVVSSSAPVRPNSFQPWHKPRKQLVREQQWWFHLNRILCESPSYNLIDDIKYFGLPGGDMLDIQFLIKKLAEYHANKKLFVHGFVNTQVDKDKAEIRLTQLSDLDNFHNESKVERHNFSALAEATSVAMQKVKEKAGYHFINLDFCDSVLNEVTLNAIIHVLHEQFKKLINIPWLLCITTRADRNSISEGLFSLLNRVFVNNIAKDTDVINALDTYLHEIMESCRSRQLHELNDDELAPLIQICFIYWMIKRAHDNQSSIQLVSSAKYKVLPSNSFHDMYSYVFRFEKPDFIPPDSLSLTMNTGVSSQPLTEQTITSNKDDSIKKFSFTRDIDEELKRNQEKFFDCKETMKRLLEECGWDVSSYDAFAVIT